LSISAASGSGSLPDNARALHVLETWEQRVPRFVKVMPKDFARVIASMTRARARGLAGEAAVLAAFEENARDLARVGGN
jgi:glutamate synthase (ferredoxin)